MKRILQVIRDEKRSVHERLFVLLSSLALISMASVFILELLLGESSELNYTLGVGFILFLFLVLSGCRSNRMNLTATVIAAIAILLLFPVVFFTSGGIYGGAPVWFVFCTMFFSLIVYGKLRYLFLLIEAVIAGICYYLAYEHPEFVTDRRLSSVYIGSLVSILFVGFTLNLMVGFEIRMLRRETEHSKEQSRKIEEMNRAQNRFFSSMSHEIRTPINTIIGLNEMTLREENISDEVAENARNIQSASGILLSLINDILDMSKMESGKMEIVHIMYDTGKMISDIVKMISVNAQKKGLTFAVDVDPTLPAQLVSDEVRLKQILINLLNNAVKYTETGSVTLSVHYRRTDGSKVLVTYSVADTGVGIRKENIPHLFDAFERIDEHKNRFIEGTGLGLAIVKQIVDLLGGDISVNSIYTQGSVFEVTIGQEAVDDQEIGMFSMERFKEQSDLAKMNGRFEAPKAHVLIVDDNTANLLVAEKLLRRTLVQTETAESGEQCLKLTLQKHFDLILMDHMMPGMDGIECLHAVRGQAGGLCRETPMIVLTANAGSEDQAQYRRAGFDAYLLKPVDADALEETVRNLLPADLVTGKGAPASSYVSGEAVRAVKRKIPLLITTDSVSDIPKELLKALDIRVMPYKIYTEKGVFDDGLEADGDVLLRSIREENLSAHSDCPSVEEYEEFFAQQLSCAQHIIHIAMGQRASGGYANAAEAAVAFYNVTVIDSGHLSSGMGLMAIRAAAAVKEEPFVTAEEIREQCENIRNCIQTSFVLEKTDYLCRSGHLTERMNRFCKAFMIHPKIVMRNSGMSVGSLYFGTLRQARRAYIRKSLRDPHSISTDMLFITYAGMRTEEIEEIRNAVLEIVPFEKVYMQKASPAVSANCGDGTFGLIFARTQHE